MPLNTTTKVFAVDDAKVAILLTDVTTNPTYATAIDVPGITKVGLSFDLKNVELRGDNRRLDSDTIVLGVKVTFDHAKLSLDALNVFLGSTVTASGSTPNQITKVTGKGTDSCPSFFFGARTPAAGTDVASGDIHLQFPKLKIAKYELGLTEEDYQTFSGEATGSFTVSNDTLWQLVYHETAAAITTAL
jgi:hypothetical protein